MNLLRGNYIDRLTDSELERKLNASGALLIRGAKACGKTQSAMQFAKSFIQLDSEPNVSIMMQTAPRLLLQGDTPRLIDEWQAEPEIWNLVRHEVDYRQMASQFILTGSANPEEEVKMHSGAGRFTILDMHTMSWQELGYSSGKLSLGAILEGGAVEYVADEVGLEELVERMVKGGFPTILNKSLSDSKQINRAYIELLAEVDMRRLSMTKRDPIKVRSLLRSLARNISTLTEITTIEKDIKMADNLDITRPTIYNYLDALHRLMIIEEQPAWNIHIRSSAQLRKTPKRHFVDVCLAIAVLGLDERSLLLDLKFLGFLFESLAIHELKVYAQVNDAKVYHYRDSSGVEVDAIVQKYNGDWSAFEIKLGKGQVEEAAIGLKRFRAGLDDTKSKPPKSLNIITGTGPSYTREDGINVISLSALGA